MKDLNYLHRLPEGDEEPEGGDNPDEGGSGLPPKTPPPIPPLKDSKWEKLIG